MKRMIFAAVMAIVGVYSFQMECHAENARVSSKEALQNLIKGNERFINDVVSNCDVAHTKREESVEKQRPFAVILGCADSRISPELIFDQSFGEIFVVRVAGNVVDPLGIESVEYSVVNFGSSLVVVLGHENCGAVSAVLNNQAQDYPAIASLIAPAIKRVQEQKPTNAVESAVKANVKAVAANLLSNKLIEKYVREGKVAIVGAYYSMKTGKVEFLEDHNGNKVQ